MAISKIGSRGIVDCSVAAADFAPGTITGAKLAGSIGNDKLANSAITIGGEAISLGGTDNLTIGAVAYPEPMLEVLNPITEPEETLEVASAFTKLN